MEITVQGCKKKEKKRITFILIITRVKVYKSEPHDTCLYLEVKEVLEWTLLLL